MSKYRIVEKDSLFFPEEKFLLFWFNITIIDFKTFRYEEVRFKTLKEATEFLDNYTLNKTKNKSTKIIHNYKGK